MQPLITSSHCTSEKNLLCAQFLLSLPHWYPTCGLLLLCRHLLHFSVSVRHLFMKAWKLQNQTRSVQKLTSFIPFSESWELYSSILFRTSSSDRSFVLLSSSSFASFCCKSREKGRQHWQSQSFFWTSRWCCSQHHTRKNNKRSLLLRWSSWIDIWTKYINTCNCNPSKEKCTDGLVGIQGVLKCVVSPLVETGTTPPCPILHLCQPQEEIQLFWLRLIRMLQTLHYLFLLSVVA